MLVPAYVEFKCWGSFSLGTWQVTSTELFQHQPSVFLETWAETGVESSAMILMLSFRATVKLISVCMGYKEIQRVKGISGFLLISPNFNLFSLPSLSNKKQKFSMRAAGKVFKNICKSYSFLPLALFILALFPIGCLWFFLHTCCD